MQTTIIARVLIYVRLTMFHNGDSWHIAEATRRGGPKGTALCGLECIPQRPGDPPTWGDTHLIAPPSFCPVCERLAGGLAA